MDSLCELQGTSLAHFLIITLVVGVFPALFVKKVVCPCDRSPLSVGVWCVVSHFRVRSGARQSFWLSCKDANRFISPSTPTHPDALRGAVWVMARGESRICCRKETVSSCPTFAVVAVVVVSMFHESAKNVPGRCCCCCLFLCVASSVLSCGGQLLRSSVIVVLCDHSLHKQASIVVLCDHSLHKQASIVVLCDHFLLSLIHI